MHEPVIESLEEILSGGAPRAAAAAHLNQCSLCRDEVAAMRKQNDVFHALRNRYEVEPPAGFYARVINRIETQTRPSVWSLFGESVFAKRLAYASMSFVVLMGTYFVSSGGTQQPPVVNAPESIMAAEDRGQTVSNDTERDRETILVTLATYEE